MFLTFKLANGFGLLEAADIGIQNDENPKDVFFLNLDRKGEWKVVSEDHLKRTP